MTGQNEHEMLVYACCYGINHLQWLLLLSPSLEKTQTTRMFRPLPIFLQLSHEYALLVDWTPEIQMDFPPTYLQGHLMPPLQLLAECMNRLPGGV